MWLSSTKLKEKLRHIAKAPTTFMLFHVCRITTVGVSQSLISINKVPRVCMNTFMASIRPACREGVRAEQNPLQRGNDKKTGAVEPKTEERSHQIANPQGAVLLQSQIEKSSIHAGYS